MAVIYSIDVKGALATRRAAFAMAVAASLIATSAAARLSTGYVLSELASLGFGCLGKVRLRGAIYEIDACDAKGRPVLLRVDPDTAKVLRVLPRD